MPTAYLVVSAIGLVLTLNALRPPRAEVLSVFTFFPGWLVSELPLHTIAGQAIATGIFAGFGALHGWQGWTGLGLTAVSWAGLLVVASRGAQAGAVVDEVLRDAAELRTHRRDRRWIATPFKLTDREVEVIKGIPYIEGAGRAQQLDIYRPRTGLEHAPVLLYIHGGGWVFGDKREQGRPMMLELASAGWVCVTANYRLSPKVAFPELLVDCKRALAWVKAHIAEYGGDPSRVAVSGGSAGGHLAALVALTSGRPELQPGFEEADLSVVAAVPFYGVYDFTNREGLHGWGFNGFIERTVMQTSPAADPELYKLASPTDQVHRDAPPFFVLHGRNDTLVPVKEARTFVRELRAVSTQPVVYAELPGAQHAFEVFRSIRSAQVVPRIDVFLRAVLDTAPR